VDQVAVTPTITAGAYSANDVIGGLMTFQFKNMNSGGMVGSIRIRDNGAVGPAMVLYVFREAPTTTADNAAFSLLDADSDKLMGIITVPTWIDFTAFKWVACSGHDDTTSREIDFRTPNGAVYIYAKVTGTPTMTATTDLRFDVTMWGD
jgi:hypothetical protein